MTEVINNNMPALYAALAKAQGQFQPIEKNREVQIQMYDKQTRAPKGSYKFRYADLQEVLAKTRPALAANGLALVQTIEPTSTGQALVCKLVHAEGGSIISQVPMASARDLGDPKAFGAAISYLRRYLVTAMLGVAADDDLDEDGQEAGALDGGNAQAGKGAVQMPQRRAAVQQQPREDQARTVQPINSAALATSGEFAYLEKKIAAAGIDWARAHEMAGIEFVPDTQLTKAAFAAIKAVL